MKCNPQTVIDIAISQIGYHEKASNSQLDDFTANSGNNNWNKYARDIDTKYPGFYNGKKNGYDWCDIFVGWCFITAYGRENAQRLLCLPNYSLGAGCEYSYRYYKYKGQTGTTPKKGAQIFFGDLDHTGVVIDFDNSYVYTVEGNSGNEVKKKKYLINDSYIYGYGYPNYNEEMTGGSTYSGQFPKIPPRGYYLTGDGYSAYTAYKNEIKKLQQFLNWAINSQLEIDGCYGPMTTRAVTAFQRVVGVDTDGSYGPITESKAKTFRR